VSSDRPEDYTVGIPRPPSSVQGAPRGLVRVPFVRRCRLTFKDGSEREAFLVNLNVLGAYILDETLPNPGEPMRCRFGLPDSERVLALSGVVAWVNAHQQHPIHGLPRGFGLRFQDIPPEDLKLLEDVVEEQAARRAGLPGA
jgi:hypothetical protein